MATQKITSENIVSVLDTCYDKAINGIPKVSKGPCVLLDHFASCALKEENVVRIFMYADFEYRSARYAKENGLGAAAARKKLKKLDHMHDAYYRNGNRRWGYAGNYMITVDTTGSERIV